MSAYLQFSELEVPKRAVTKRWEVGSLHDGSLLGWVYYRPTWRRYIFHPVTVVATQHDAECLRELAQFLEDETKRQRGRTRTP